MELTLINERFSYNFNGIEMELTLINERFSYNFNGIEMELNVNKWKTSIIIWNPFFIKFISSILPSKHFSFKQTHKLKRKVTKLIQICHEILKRCFFLPTLVFKRIVDITVNFSCQTYFSSWPQVLQKTFISFMRPIIYIHLYYDIALFFWLFYDLHFS